MMHSPPIFEQFSHSVKNFLNFTFSQKMSWFSSAKISDDLFLVINHKFQISPYFPCFSTFSLYFAKIYYFPLLSQISPLFSKNSPAFYILSVYFVSPPTLTMMHLCITQCTYWTPLTAGGVWRRFRDQITCIHNEMKWIHMESHEN